MDYKTHHPLYNTWKKMRDRCNNPKSHNFAHYGGRGIAICERWNNFDLFIKDMGNRPSDKHTLDRIDSNGDYSRRNCRWATKEEQNRNRSNCTKVDGKTLAEIARDIGMDRTSLYYRNKKYPLKIVILPSHEFHTAIGKSLTRCCEPIDSTVRSPCSRLLLGTNK